MILIFSAQYESEIITTLGDACGLWAFLVPAARYELLQLVIWSIVVSPDKIKLVLCVEGRLMTSVTTFQGNGKWAVVTANPDASTVTAFYENGRVVREVDSLLGESVYEYDEFNRVVSKNFSENGVSKKILYTYNSASRVLTQAETAGSGSRLTGYVYDELGRRVSMTMPGGRLVN